MDFIVKLEIFPFDILFYFGDFDQMLIDLKEKYSVSEKKIKRFKKARCERCDGYAYQVKGEQMGVKFNIWLDRDPEQPLENKEIINMNNHSIRL